MPFCAGARGAGANFGHAVLKSCDFARSDLTGAQFTYADLTGSEFDRSGMHDCDLRQAELKNVKFGQADLSYARFRGANLFAADLRGADLTGAQELIPAQLSQARTDGTRFFPTEAAVPTAASPERKDRRWLSRAVHCPNSTPRFSRPMAAMMAASTKTVTAVSAIAVA